MTTMRIASLLLLIGTSAAAQTRAFTGATLVDPTRRAPVENAVIVVRDGRVVAAGPAASTTIPQGAERIALAGKFVIPGLINAHGHVNGPEDLATYAAYGVTTIFSLGGEPASVFAARDAQATPALNRARVFVSGPVVAARTAADAEKAVADLVAMKADMVKIRVDDNLGTAQKMPPEAYNAVIAAAHAAGLRVAAHVYYLRDAIDLVRPNNQRGVDVIAHSVRDTALSGAFIHWMREKNVCYVPTLMREVSTYVYESRPAFFSDSLFLAHANRQWIAQFSGPEAEQQHRTRASAQTYKKQLPLAMQNAGLLAANTTIGMGTDTGPAGRFQGYFELMELEMMREAGLTPRQILTAATIDAARCHKAERELGSIEPGKWADFVVLDGNPIQNVGNYRKISAVYVAGNRVPR